jgi:hypothetical protein
MNGSIRVERREDVQPICPHCSAELRVVLMRELSGTFFGRRYICFCSQCSKALGFSHRKGFWMG